jgi:potassium-transporting ATPase KdpC subunit
MRHDKTTDNPIVVRPEPQAKKSRFLRPALMSFAIFTVLCGVVYPLTVTIISQALFPYESNGSQVTVTLKDGTKKVYGSALIGQEYENPIHMFGRVNTGVSNLAVDSDEYKTLISERKAKLNASGFLDPIPSELVTSSGSGVDPHISPSTAYYQVTYIISARAATTETSDDISTDTLDSLIDRYTEDRLWWIFGEPRVNVLLVNLAMDGLL